MSAGKEEKGHPYPSFGKEVGGGVLVDRCTVAQTSGIDPDDAITFSGETAPPYEVAGQETTRGRFAWGRCDSRPYGVSFRVGIILLKNPLAEHDAW